ncbi:MAG: RNA-directed DNA polymerase [Clostridia bacterium]|nr:RNA-directed DNA polymerase [Clostridia bacterium]
MPIGDIYDEMTSFTALHQAYTEVTKGKREKEETLIFERNLERNLHELSHDLRNGKVPQARYGSFYVYVPKARKVIYADLTTKIIQRAIYDAINPRITKQLVADTYACIPGRGQLAAMERVRGWMEMTRNEPGMWGYYKYDAAKFFYRIDHGILMWLLGKKISDLRLLDLLGYYIDGTGMAFGLPPGRDPLEVTEDEMLADVGIPIGGGLSHTLGNVYLDPLDQYIKRDLRCRRYARYMDDGIIFDNDRERLRENAKRIEEFANVRLALEFNSKTAIRPASRGVEWVGYDIYDDHVRLRKSTTLHMKRRLKKTMEDYRDGRITLHDAGQTVAAYKALLKHCDMDRFDDYIWNQFFVLQRGEATADGHRQNATGQRV